MAKKPKKPKMGKVPSSKSSVEVMKRYLAREKDKKKDYEAKLRKHESDAKEKVKLRRDIATLKQNRSK